MTTINSSFCPECRYVGGGHDTGRNVVCSHATAEPATAVPADVVTTPICPAWCDRTHGFDSAGFIHSRTRFGVTVEQAVFPAEPWESWAQPRLWLGEVTQQPNAAHGTQIAQALTEAAAIVAGAR